jgi:hypothetical protein
LCHFRTPRDNGYTQSRSLVYPEIAWLDEQGINI